MSIDDLDKILDKVEEEITDDLKRETYLTAEFIRNDAVEHVPVDKGRLQISINVEKISDFEYEIGTNVSSHPDVKGDGYGDYVEFGTSKMPPRPYLRPAHEKGLKRIRKKIEELTDKVMNRYFGN
jgi:HK97 gp10 family phage protein